MAAARGSTGRTSSRHEFAGLPFLPVPQSQSPWKPVRSAANCEKRWARSTSRDSGLDWSGWGSPKSESACIHGGGVGQVRHQIGHDDARRTVGARHGGGGHEAGRTAFAVAAPDPSAPREICGSPCWTVRGTSSATSPGGTLVEMMGGLKPLNVNQRPRESSHRATGRVTIADHAEIGSMMPAAMELEAQGEQAVPVDGHGQEPEGVRGCPHSCAWEGPDRRHCGTFALWF